MLISHILTYQKKISGESVTTRSFVYLNNQIAGFMDKDENGVESIRYTVTDIQGTVTEIYDENYNLLWKSDYTAFGIKAGETTKLLDFDGLYTGCDYDAETGLSYHWNRWRSEDGDSWLSQDPARDGLNWYGYAGQNPVNFSDNTGLFYYTAEGQKSSFDYHPTTTSGTVKNSSADNKAKKSKEETKSTTKNNSSSSTTSNSSSNTTSKETKEKTEAKAPNLTTNGNLSDEMIKLAQEIKNKKFYSEPKYTESGMLILEVDSIESIPTSTQIMNNAINSGAKFMSDYGGVIAIACYASGNIGLGIIIDGITIACDISLTTNKYYEKEITSSQALLEIATSVAATATGAKCGKNFEKAAYQVLLNPKTTEIVANSISDFVGQGFSTLIDIQIEQ